MKLKKTKKTIYKEGMGNTNDIMKPFTNNGPLFFSEHKIIAKQLIFYETTTIHKPKN